MNNSQALGFFGDVSGKGTDKPGSEKLTNSNDHTQTDAAFIMKYANYKTRILDIGSGSGLIINRIYDKVKSVDCIEPFENFSKHIIKADNVCIHNCSVFDFNGLKRYDLVTLFGFMHYVNEDEAGELYSRVKGWLNPGGRIIVKNQFGINEDVTIGGGYSQELGSEYFAQYRFIDKEIKMIYKAGFQSVQCCDIYPPEANRWDNTHFYALVAE